VFLTLEVLHQAGKLAVPRNADVQFFVSDDRCGHVVD